MSKKSMNWYLENNDFEGAKERLETTNATWKERWFNVCATIFGRVKELAKKYFLDPFEKTVKVINKATAISPSNRKSKYDENILIAEDCDSLLDNATQKCYLFSFLNDDDELVCSKVGTTTRKVLTRLKEELNSKTYTSLGCTKAIIHRVYDCGQMPAEGLESFFRATYIKKYPNSFKKNDRFINEKFDLIQADKIACSYLSV